MSLIIPETDIIYLIPLNFEQINKQGKNAVSNLLRDLYKKQHIKGYEIPAEIDEVKGFLEKYPILGLMYESDIDYFDSDYLDLKRFGRALVDELKVRIPTRRGAIEVNVTVLLTVFEIGIGVLVFWLQNMENLAKEDIIDLTFIRYKEIFVNGETKTTLMDYIKKLVNERFGKGAIEKDEALLEDMFTMIFIRGMRAPNGKLPDSFIEEHEGMIFDILTFPERYYPKKEEDRNKPGAYTYHKTRTKEYVREVLNNISVRNDFPVFVSNNRFLGIKIHTSERDYWVERKIKPLTKRIIFNLTLYSNAVLQSKLLKNISNKLSNIIKDPRGISLNELVKMRESIFRDLEEYINTSIQRYEVWKKAMEDAMKELSIPEMYKAVKERLDMLNSFISVEHQRSSERLFYLLNTLLIISSTLSFIEIFAPNISIEFKLAGVLIAALIWILITYSYIRRYII